MIMNKYKMDWYRQNACTQRACKCGDSAEQNHTKQKILQRQQGKTCEAVKTGKINVR